MIKPQSVSNLSVKSRASSVLIFTLTTQKTSRVFIIETYKGTRKRVSKLYYHGSTVLPSRHSARTTIR
jgi:hypothetical protein